MINNKYKLIIPLQIVPSFAASIDAKWRAPWLKTVSLWKYVWTDFKSILESHRCQNDQQIRTVHIIPIYSGITSGRVLNGKLFYTKILEVNLFAFAHRLFHEDFSPINHIYVEYHWAKKPLSTSKNVLFPGHNHLLTTGADDSSLYLSLIIKASAHWSASVVSRWLWLGNRTVRGG